VGRSAAVRARALQCPITCVMSISGGPGCDHYGFRADEARDAGQAMPDRTAWKICSSLTGDPGRSWAIRQELRIAIVTWIERSYHRRRRQTALGRLTPIEYETIMTTSVAQAA
jgi:transposase InsO family protein